VNPMVASQCTKRFDGNTALTRLECAERGTETIFHAEALLEFRGRNARESLSRVETSLIEFQHSLQRIHEKIESQLVLLAQADQNFERLSRFVSLSSRQLLHAYREGIVNLVQKFTVVSDCVKQRFSTGQQMSNVEWSEDASAMMQVSAILRSKVKSRQQMLMTMKEHNLEQITIRHQEQKEALMASFSDQLTNVAHHLSERVLSFDSWHLPRFSEYSKLISCHDTESKGLLKQKTLMGRMNHELSLLRDRSAKCDKFSAADEEKKLLLVDIRRLKLSVCDVTKAHANKLNELARHFDEAKQKINTVKLLADRGARVWAQCGRLGAEQQIAGDYTLCGIMTNLKSVSAKLITSNKYMALDFV
jgi:hypothetical protein